MTGSRMAMSSDFLAAFAKLPSQQQRLVRAMISRFERDSRASGLNYERIAGAKDPNMRSLRIDGGYRAVVLKPAEGNVHILLWADKHDDAYQWATRHACSINAETGALQVYQPQPAAEEAEEAAETPPTDTPGIFGQLKHRELLRLGVPAPMAAEVLEIRDEAALEEMVPRLPVEAYEALFLYMAGEAYEQIILERESPPEPVDTTDFATALRRDETRSRFVVIDNDRELEEMFSAPLERWRVFLHPSQRRLVERHWNGPVRVLGGAGTGKTVVAMHRARWLARNLPEGERILFTTFTRNLAADIENNLRAICTPEEMKRIEVVNLDRWVQRFLRGKRYRLPPHLRSRPGRLAGGTGEEARWAGVDQWVLQRRVGAGDSGQRRDHAGGLPACREDWPRRSTESCCPRRRFGRFSRSTAPSLRNAVSRRCPIAIGWLGRFWSRVVPAPTWPRLRSKERSPRWSSMKHRTWWRRRGG